MLAGELYQADDPEIRADLESAEKRAEACNHSPVDTDARLTALAALVGEVGQGACVRPPLRVDYGYRITLGPRTFVNCGAVMLDVAPITVGADVQIGPKMPVLT